jgi:hypothetical protein
LFGEAWYAVFAFECSQNTYDFSKQRYWRANTPGSVDVATLEGLLEEQRSSSSGQRRKSANKGGSRKNKSKTKAMMAMGSLPENHDLENDAESQTGSHQSEIV